MKPISSRGARGPMDHYMVDTSEDRPPTTQKMAPENAREARRRARYRKSILLSTGTRYRSVLELGITGYRVGTEGYRADTERVPSDTERYRAGTERYREVPSGYRADTEQY
ncbi:hypothetical protein M5K25_012850 [Dendrobium thyrsiflorum]|uniref:Uncharacterized protein n=1 Tax=Dendrobium thyrsiflorum TaxID=117978 RepID=A0ABD0UYI8_DENTH